MKRKFWDNIIYLLWEKCLWCVQVICYDTYNRQPPCSTWAQLTMLCKFSYFGTKI